MEAVDPGMRHRATLPSIGYLDVEKIKRDGADYPQRYPSMTALSVSTAPSSLVSPTMYSGPPPPYSYPSSATGSAPATSGYISPPDSRPAAQDDKDLPSAHQRQSLPSIHEALGGDKSIPYSTPVSSIPPPPPPPQHSSQHPLTPSHSAPSSAMPHSLPDAPPGPPNPFSQGPNSTSFLRENPYAQLPNPPQNMHPQVETPKPSFSAINAQEPRPSLQSLSQPKSPMHASRPGLQTLPAHSYGPTSAGPVSSPNGFSSYQPTFPYSTHPSNPPSSTFAPMNNASRQSQLDPWSRSPEMKRPEEGKKSIFQVPPGQPYSESVKRHLDVYDIEMALNEIAEGSNRSLEFSHVYRTRSHQTQRTGPTPNSLPGLPEVEDLVRQSNRVTEALARIRDVIVNQQNALAAEQAQSRAYKSDHYDDESHLYSDDFKGLGGFAGAEAKKRRGKAAPPGRCHSCNRAETPEWRRGPDGARTLCNACGLHYAKLTRKMGVNKATLAGSNLRPKNMDPRSPQM